MSDFLEQFGAELAAKIEAIILPRIEARLEANAKREFKLFFTPDEVGALLGCSTATVLRRFSDGSLGYTRNLKRQKGCLRHHLEEYFARREVRAVSTGRQANNVVEIKRKTA